MIAADYPFLDVMWTMVVFFLWIIWFWLLFTVFADIFRRRDISGWGKAAWIVFAIPLPFLGVFVYLITQSDEMAKRNLDQARAQQAQFDDYVRETAERRRGRGDRQGQAAPRLGSDHAGRVRGAQAEGARVAPGRRRNGRDRTRRLRDHRLPGQQVPGGDRTRARRPRESNTIRLIDVAFVGKDEDGNVLAFELTELDPDVQESLDTLGIEVQGLLNEDDLQDAADALEPNSSAAVLVWENVWARTVTQAMRDAGGVLLAFERIPHEVVQAAREWVVEQAKA